MGFHFLGSGQNHNSTSDEISQLLSASEEALPINAKKSENYAREAIRLAENQGHATLRCMALLKLSDAFYQISLSDSALHYAHKATECAKDINETRLIGLGYLATARVYSSLKIYDKQLALIQLVEQLASEMNDNSLLANAYKHKSVYYGNLDDFESSHQMIQLAKKHAEIAGDSSIQLAIAMDKALQFLRNKDYGQGLQVYDSLLAQPIRLISTYTIYHNLIFIHLELGELKEADVLSKAFLELAGKHSSIDHLIQAKYDRIGVLKALNEPHAALEMFYELDELEDSIYTVELSHALSDMQARFDVEQKDAELNIAQTEIENSELRQRFLLVGLSFVLVLMISLIFIFKQRVKNRELLANSEKQKKELFEIKNVELKSALEQIGEKNREITDSITYAKRIQEAILPSHRSIKARLGNSFVFYKPKDIVAGDFYWLESYTNAANSDEEIVLFAAADCTGHGVPGAMVSVVCHNALNRAVREFALTEPAKILDKTLELVVEQFAKAEEDVKDGMDIALCALNTKTKVLQFAGAHNPLWIISDRESIEISTEPSSNKGPFLHEIKANKQPIGKYIDAKPFTNHTFQLAQGDSIYIFTDGYADQFGGIKGKKFKYSSFKELLVSLQTLPIIDQKEALAEKFESWRGDLEQVDDVCVIGVRV